MSTRKEEWRDVPGFGGWYQVSDWGRVRTWRAGGAAGKRLKAPKIMDVNTDQRIATVCLTADDGTRKRYGMMRLVADIWLGGLPHGMRTIHKDGNIFNNSRWNIGIVSEATARKKSAAAMKAVNRKPVIVMGCDLKIIEAYPSAKDAARQTAYSSTVVIRRCNLQVARVVSPSGLIFAWDDDNWLRKTLQRARAELDALGIRYNDPHTERYYDLQEAPDLDLDPDILWLEAPACGGVPFWNQPNFDRSVRA